MKFKMSSDRVNEFEKCRQLINCYIDHTVVGISKITHVRTNSDISLFFFEIMYVVDDNKVTTTTIQINSYKKFIELDHKIYVYLYR